VPAINRLRAQVRAWATAVASRMQQRGSVIYLTCVRWPVAARQTDLCALLLAAALCLLAAAG
jgi:hypothetical protein